MSKESLWTPLTSCFQNCKIEFCSIILQFCRCGGLFDAKGNPDGFLSHFSSLRNFWLGGFSCSLTGCGPPVSVYSIRGPAVNRMFSFDARPSWRVVGEGHAPPLQGACVCPAVGTNRQCLPEIATVPVGPLREPAGGTKPPQRSSPLRRQLFRKNQMRATPEAFAASATAAATALPTRGSNAFGMI